MKNSLRRFDVKMLFHDLRFAEAIKFKNAACG